MSETSIEAQIWSQVDDTAGVSEVIDQLDALSMTGGLHPRYKLAIERMAFELTAQQDDLHGAFRRYRLISYSPQADPGELGWLVVRLGDLAIDARNDVLLARIRAELARLLTWGRLNADPTNATDWEALAQVLDQWDRPEVIRAERAFETLVDDWMRDGGPEQPGMIEELRVLAHNAGLLTPDGSAAKSINGRRVFWAISLLVGERNDPAAAWDEYRSHGEDMSASRRAAALLVIARALETGPLDARLLTDVYVALVELAKTWPVPRALKDQRVRIATAPVLLELAETLMQRTRGE